MKIENLSQELKEKVKQLLESAPADQKADAIMQSIEMIEEAAHADLINQVVAEAEKASHDAEFKKQLGLRNLSQEEKKFYEGFKDIKQSVTANQIDIIPTEIIDRTLDDSPLIEKYPTVHYKVMSFEDVKMRADASEDDETNGTIICDTQEQLEGALKKKCEEQYAAGVDKPKITIKADMELLQNTELYEDVKELEAVSLGDTVHCKHSKLRIVSDARVIELEWDAVRNKLISVTLGKFQYNFLNNVSSIMNRVEQAIRSDGSLIGQQVQGTINGVKAQLRAQSSIAKKQTVRAVLFEDLDPDSPTFGAMCLGTLGFEIASERTADGRDWKWSTFGTGQGFFADFIVAGTMLADRIKGGTLELGGAGNGNGVAKVLNADGNEIVRLDKDGVYAKGKYVCANTDGSQTATLSNGKLTFKTESYEVVIRAGAIGGLTGLMIYPEQGAVRTKFLSIGDKLSARFDNISLLASGKTTIGGASLEVQRDGKGYSGKTGKAVFSDGTYLEYVNGFLVGGNTKEGGF